MGPSDTAIALGGSWDFGVVRRSWDSIHAILDPKVLFSLPRLSRTFDQDGTVNWGKLVFVITCLLTMAGCGILSSFMRRKSLNRLISRKRLRRAAARRDTSKGSAGTITSSDDEEYDSSGSLRNVTDRSSHEEKVAPQRREQSEEGKCPNKPLSSTSY